MIGEQVIGKYYTDIAEEVTQFKIGVAVDKGDSGVLIQPNIL